MKLTIFGNDENVSKQLIRLALEAGHEVTVLAGKPERQYDNLRVVIGGLDDPRAVESAIEGAEAVLSTLGAQSNAPDHIEAFKKTIENIAKSMESEGVKRFVSISSSRVIKRNHKSAMPRATPLSRLLLKTIGRYHSDTKQIEYEIIDATNLDWILVSPYTMAPGPPTGTYGVYESIFDISHIWRTAGLNASQKRASVEISEGDVAHLMLSCVTGDKWMRGTPIPFYDKQ